MYNEEYDEEETSESSETGLKNFYNNNKKMVWLFCGILLFVLIIAILPKGGNNSATKIEYEISIKEVDKDIVTIGSSLNLEAEVKNNPKATIEWSTSDENIATVDNGNVKAIGYGKVTIMATYIQDDGEKKTATKDITVADGDPNVILKDVSFKDGDLFMPPYETYKLSLVPNPSNAYITNKKFISSDENIVTVDETGTVTATGEGTATITFDINDGTFRKELQVYVDRNQTRTEIVVTPTEISFDGELIKVKVGTKEKLSYTVEPEKTDKSKLIWKSSDEDIITVDESGKITALKEGHATVTLSSINGKKDEVDIDVENDIVEVTDINLTMDTIYLQVGQNQLIMPAIVPSNASNKAMSFTPLDPTIAVAQPNDTGTGATIYALNAGATSVIIKPTGGTNGVEKILNVIVSGPANTDNPTQEPTKTSKPTVTATPTPTPKPTTVVNATLSCPTVKVGLTSTCTINNGTLQEKIYVANESIVEVLSTSSRQFTVKGLKSGTTLLYTNINGQRVSTEVIVTGSSTPATTAPTPTTVSSPTPMPTATPIPKSYSCNYFTVDISTTDTKHGGAYDLNTHIDTYKWESGSQFWATVVYLCVGDSCETNAEKARNEAKNNKTSPIDVNLGTWALTCADSSAKNYLKPNKWYIDRLDYTAQKWMQYLEGCKGKTLYFMVGNDTQNKYSCVAKVNPFTSKNSYTAVDCRKAVNDVVTITP